MNMNKLEKAFIKNIVAWFKINKRDLSFRITKDPYKIWISEVMAQQTQIDTLLPYYERFIEKYPDVSSLASSDLDELYLYWEGLGYYSRAKNLHKAAKIIATLEEFPKTYKELIKLPGIGPYTAGAIASICFNERVPAIDGNVNRVLSRYFCIEEELGSSQFKNTINNLLIEMIPENSGDFNESIMELGALICLPKNPKCLLCPLSKDCLALREGNVTLLPIKKEKSKRKKVENIALILREGNKPLYVKRENEKLLNDSYGIPLIEKENTVSIDTLLENFNLTGNPEFLGTVKHNFTNLTWITDVYSLDIKKEDIPPNFSKEAGMVPTAFKKMLSLSS